MHILEVLIIGTVNVFHQRQFSVMLGFLVRQVHLCSLWGIKRMEL